MRSEDISIDWFKITFAIIVLAILATVFLWQWWLGVWLFLVTCYGFKSVTYAIIFGIISLITIIGLISIF